MNKKRVVVTGIGILSSIGTKKQTVLSALQEGKSGINHSPEFAEAGMMSKVYGDIALDANEVSERIHRKYLRFMGDPAIYAILAALDATEDAGLSKEDLAHNQRISSVSGTGGIAAALMCHESKTLLEKGLKFTSPFSVPKIMNSSLAANIATFFELHGSSLSVSAACSTSTHAIGLAYEDILNDKSDVVLAVGADELSYNFAFPFDAMKALSRKRNDQPQKASRAYDKDRDGFVISGGSGALVLEDYEHAKKRNAPIYAEIVGYGSGSDGLPNMVQPNPDGAARCIRSAVKHISLSDVDYINTHGTSTPVGDLSELKAIEKIFGDNVPLISSTKSMTGHSLGACGAQEAIYCLLMMQNKFIAPSINIDEIDPEAEKFPIVQETRSHNINYCISNNFGFGGNNSCLVFKKLES